MDLFIIAGAIGPWEIVLVVAIALLIFWGSKIPGLMKGLGEGIKEFKKAARGAEKNNTNKEKEIK